MNVIMFIIRVLKLLLMQGKYILFALMVILLICSPVAAITNKVATGAPVFVGESNLNIVSAIGDCHIIAWWPDERNMTGPAARNFTVKQLNEANGLATAFNVSPEVFTGYTGNWYCEDKKPTFVVLTVVEPNLSIRVWDIDNNKDVTGQTIPTTTNITYRIDTNLYQAMDYYKRTDLTPADGIFTVTMTNPVGKQMTNIYTGNVGSPSTKILVFDSNPFITTPSYIGRNLEAWNRLTRDTTGALLYPSGIYTFSVTQNLNHMKESFASSSIKDTNGKTSSSASITFLPLESLTPTLVPTLQANLSPTPEITAVTTILEPSQTQRTATQTQASIKIPAGKTTYTPLPTGIVLAGIVCAGLLAMRKRQ
jgi:hypothetical protein